MPGRGRNPRRGQMRGPSQKNLFFGKSARQPSDPPTINARPWVSAVIILSKELTTVSPTWGFTIGDILNGMNRQFGVNNASSFSIRLSSVKVWAASKATPNTIGSVQSQPIDMSAAFINPVLAVTDPPLLVLQDSGTTAIPAKASFHYGDILSQRYISSTGNTDRQFLRVTVDNDCDVDVHVSVMWAYYSINPVTPSRIRREEASSSRTSQVRPMNVNVPDCDEEGPHSYDELQPLHSLGNSPPARNGFVSRPTFEQMLDSLELMTIGDE